MAMELQDQLYLITGLLSTAILVLFLFVIALIIQFKKERTERIKNEERFLTTADPSIRRGEELERRGFVPYQGPEIGHHSDHNNHHKPIQRQQSYNDGHNKKNSKKQGPHGAQLERIPSINTSIYHGYQGRVTDPIPSIYPQQSQYNARQSGKKNYH